MRPPQLAAALLTIASVAAAPAPTLAAGPDVAEATLDNGLRVLVLEDHRSPIVSVQVWYRVGSRNELPGATGLAHFLEHMMFKGTPTHGKGEFSRLVEQNGGQDNAFTSQDVTSYYVDIAADKVDLALALEADRMRNLLLDPKEIDSERQVVMEERRTRTEDDPDGLVSEEMMSLAFKAHPYRWPVIGWMEDIRRIAPAELRAFYDTYYRPNNAILVVVGDVAAPEILGRVRRLFGGIARGPEPPPVAAIEPPQIDERRLIVKKASAQVPIVNVSWHVPNFRSADAPALDLLSTILSEGRASRLYRKLTYERRLALGAGGDYSYFSLNPNLFWLYATPLPGQTPEVLEQALLAEIELVKAQPIPAEEIERAKNQVEASFVWRQDSVHSRGAALARFELLGSWRLSETYLPLVRAVTAGDLQRVARAYFPADRKNAAILLPARAGREVTRPMRRMLAVVPLLLVGTPALRRRRGAARASRGAAERRAPPRRAAPRHSHRGRARLRARGVGLRSARCGGPRQPHRRALDPRHGGAHRARARSRDRVRGREPRVRIRARREHPDPRRAAEGPRPGPRSPRRGAAAADLPRGRAAAQGGGHPGRDPALRGESGGRRRARARPAALPGTPVCASGDGDGGVGRQAHARAGRGLSPRPLSAGRDGHRRGGRRRRGRDPPGAVAPSLGMDGSGEPGRAHPDGAAIAARRRRDDQPRADAGDRLPRPPRNPPGPSGLFPAARGQLHPGRRLGVTAVHARSRGRGPRLCRGQRAVSGAVRRGVHGLAPDARRRRGGGPAARQGRDGGDGPGSGRGARARARQVVSDRQLPAAARHIRQGRGDADRHRGVRPRPRLSGSIQASGRRR